MSKFYITNAIPYVNAKPHIGHALEFIQSDAIARYHCLRGDDVKFLCGGDENALKIVQAAQKAEKEVQKFIDENSQSFYDLSKKLDITFDVWQKGSDAKHHSSSQKLWQLCSAEGDIYKKQYEGLYCVGCELFYEKEELNKEGECFEHPGKKLDVVEEENYFFKLSKYQNQLIELISSDTLQIIPSFRKNEVLSFLKNPLVDISISRSNKRAKDWGVPIPSDSSQKMYVWFDALNIYQSGIGFGSPEATDIESYKKWWPADVQVIGKGIVRFHAIYWPAFLLSAKLSLPKKLFVHEYITVNGQKMSKTLGNVIDPTVLIEKYGVDALRYYCLAKISPFSDGDFSEEKLKEAYNSDLANGLGNLAARVAKLCENNNVETTTGSNVWCADLETYMREFKFNEALAVIWQLITQADKKINQEKPWTMSGEKLKEVLTDYVKRIQAIGFNLQPFLPKTAEKILTQFSGEIKSTTTNLFPRL